VARVCVCFVSHLPTGRQFFSYRAVAYIVHKYTERDENRSTSTTNWRRKLLSFISKLGNSTTVDSNTLFSKCPRSTAKRLRRFIFAYVRLRPRPKPPSTSAFRFASCKRWKISLRRQTLQICPQLYVLSTGGELLNENRPAKIIRTTRTVTLSLHTVVVHDRLLFRVAIKQNQVVRSINNRR